jgi:hypothetical protein
MTSSREEVRRWLGVIWWPLWPAFTAMVGALTIDRACRATFDLLPGASSSPVLATPLAAVYVAAHLWLGAAIVLTTTGSGDLAPSLPAIRRVWTRDTVKLILMAAVFVVDYAPMSLWRVIGGLAGCRP